MTRPTKRSWNVLRAQKLEAPSATVCLFAIIACQLENIIIFGLKVN